MTQIYYPTDCTDLMDFIFNINTNYRELNMNYLIFNDNDNGSENFKVNYRELYVFFYNQNS